MNNKMIAIIAVIAMCGAALVGVGYAYTASVTNSNNSLDSDVDYVTVALTKDNTYNNVLKWTIPDIEYNYTDVIGANGKSTTTWTQNKTTEQSMEVKMKVTVDKSTVENTGDLYLKVADITVTETKNDDKGSNVYVDKKTPSVSVEAFSDSEFSSEIQLTNDTDNSVKGFKITFGTNQNTADVYLKFTLSYTLKETLNEAPVVVPNVVSSLNISVDWTETEAP